MGLHASEYPTVVVGADEFLSRLSEEVRRSDRYGHPFTVLIVRPPTSQEDLPKVQWLQSLASSLVRGCDIVSVFETRHIVAVLLPETDVSGGGALLERFRTEIADADQEWEYDLLEYPANWDTITEFAASAA